jgi:hypothetical protein
MVNRCPKCKGWMILNREVYRWFSECLQCSYRSVIKNRDLVIEKKNNMIWERVQNI